MTEMLLRGRTLSFHRMPEHPEDNDAFRYESDGALLIRGDRIAETGSFDKLHAAYPTAPVRDHRPHLILPGFIDTHLHMPQLQVMASWGAKLLDWLNTYTFPEEMRFSDPAHANRMAEAFFDRVLAHGTTTTVAFCTSHPASADAYFSAAAKRGMTVIGGKVMMDRNAPGGLCDTAERAARETEDLIQRWHGCGGASVAITPRFAITSTPDQLAVAGELAQAHPDCHVQTHLSENVAEIALTRDLYPDDSDYVGVYERFGLLGPKTLLGHAIHLSDREIAALADTGSHPVFCPTSNLFLGSGLFDDARLRAAGLVNGIASDVGGGTSLSMLQTLNEGYKVLQLGGQALHPYRAFHWITRGNADMLDRVTDIGTLDPGSRADLTVLDSRATPDLALRMDRAETLAEELFALMILGDDRAIAQTYVAGRGMKDKSARTAAHP